MNVLQYLTMNYNNQFDYKTFSNQQKELRGNWIDLSFFLFRIN